MNTDEYRNAQFHRGHMDERSFFGLLIRAMYKADIENLRKLSQGFPELAETVARWQTEEGYADKLISAYDNGPRAIDGEKIE